MESSQGSGQSSSLPVQIPDFQRAENANTGTTQARVERPMNIPPTAGSASDPAATADVSENVKKAMEFLNNASVKTAPISKRVAFLEKKGLSRDEIQTAFRLTQSGDPYAPASATNVQTTQPTGTPVQQQYMQPVQQYQQTVPQQQQVVQYQPQQQQQQQQQQYQQPQQAYGGMKTVNPYDHHQQQQQQQQLLLLQQQQQFQQQQQEQQLAHRRRKQSRWAFWRNLFLYSGGALGASTAAVYVAQQWLLPYWHGRKSRSPGNSTTEDDSAVTKKDISDLKTELRSTIHDVVTELSRSYNTSNDLSSIRAELSSIRAIQDQHSRQLSASNASTVSLPAGTSASPYAASPGQAYVDSLGISPVPQRTPEAEHPWKKALAQVTKKPVSPVPSTSVTSTANASVVATPPPRAEISTASIPTPTPTHHTTSPSLPKWQQTPTFAVRQEGSPAELATGSSSAPANTTTANTTTTTTTAATTAAAPIPASPAAVHNRDTANPVTTPVTGTPAGEADVSISRPVTQSQYTNASVASGSPAATGTTTNANTANTNTTTTTTSTPAAAGSSGVAGPSGLGSSYQGGNGSAAASSSITPAPPSRAPHSNSFMEVMRMVQEGKTPPGVRDIPEQPTNRVQPLSQAATPPPKKPWEVVSPSERTPGFGASSGLNGHLREEQTPRVEEITE